MGGSTSTSHISIAGSSETLHIPQSQQGQSIDSMVVPPTFVRQHSTPDTDVFWIPVWWSILSIVSSSLVGITNLSTGRLHHRMFVSCGGTSSSADSHRKTWVIVRSLGSLEKKKKKSWRLFAYHHGKGE